MMCIFPLMTVIILATLCCKQINMTWMSNHLKAQQCGCTCVNVSQVCSTEILKNLSESKMNSCVRDLCKATQLSRSLCGLPLVGMTAFASSIQINCWCFRFPNTMKSSFLREFVSQSQPTEIQTFYLIPFGFFLCLYDSDTNIISYLNLFSPTNVNCLFYYFLSIYCTRLLSLYILIDA